MSEEKIMEASSEPTVQSADFQTAPMNMSGMTETPRRRGSGLSAAVLFIGFGVILLLNNLGILDVSLLGLLRYWPVLLIIVGLDLILGRQGFLGSALMALVALALVAGVVILSLTGALNVPAGARLTGEFKEAATADALEAHIDLGIVEADIRALENSDSLFEGSYSTPDQLPITVNYNREGDTVFLTVEQMDENNGPSFPEFLGGDPLSGEFDLGLQPGVPIDLTLSVGIGDSVIDLTGLTIVSLNIEGGIGALEVILPESGDFEATLDVGIGDMQIRLPESMEAHLNYDGGIVSLDTASRLENAGEGVWETGGYDGADDRVIINIDAGIGNVEISNR